MEKKIWGNAIWYFIHTLSFKLKSEYSNKSNELMGIFYNICINTPCEFCSQDSKRILGNLNMHNINNKEDLIKVMFEFHNKVNKKINKNEFTIDEFNNKYSSANTINIIKNFLNIMRQDIRNDKAMMNNFNRKLMIENVNRYLKNNIICFNN